MAQTDYIADSAADTAQTDYSVDSFAAAADKYQPLIESMAEQYYLTVKHYADGADLDDFRQEASIALMRAVETYDPGKGVSFGLYAKICIKNRMISILRRIKRTAAIAAWTPLTNNSDSSCEITEAQKPDMSTAGIPHRLYGDPELHVIEAENYKHLKDIIDSALNEREKRVLDLYVGGALYKEIAERLNVSEKSVDNAVYRIKAKLRKRVSGKPE
ncbi:MAG: sigma-70 family RNA polymerase sigma factor [Eubacteriales bacterium]